MSPTATRVPIPATADVAGKLLRYFAHSGDVRWRRAARQLMADAPKPDQRRAKRDDAAINLYREWIAASPGAEPFAVVRAVIRELSPDATPRQFYRRCQKLRSQLGFVPQTRRKEL